MAISPKYASPGLRLGLLLHDHPFAAYRFEHKKGTEIGVPKNFGGDGDFLLATIIFGDGRADASAWKPLPANGDPDQLNVLQTKTLGRALKKAGYPDDLDDLKALVLWRQRDAEIAAITNGTQQVSIASSAAREAGVVPDQLQQALSEAAVTSSDDDVVVDVEADGERAATVNELAAGLSGRSKAGYTAYLESIGAPEDATKMTSDQLTNVLAWLDPDGD
jgi:hypothetical protein